MNLPPLEKPSVDAQGLVRPFSLPQTIPPIKRMANNYPDSSTSTNNFDPFSASNENQFRLQSMNIPIESTQNFNNERRPSISKQSNSKIYALRIAATPGIFFSWSMAKTLIDGCPGAKYKGFFTIEDCMKFIWEQFPSATFSVNADGDYIMDDPEPVYQVLISNRL